MEICPPDLATLGSEGFGPLGAHFGSTSCVAYFVMQIVSDVTLKEMIRDCEAV